jgi:hypothetical protein
LRKGVAEAARLVIEFGDVIRLVLFRRDAEQHHGFHGIAQLRPVIASGSGHDLPWLTDGAIRGSRFLC